MAIGSKCIGNKNRIRQERLYHTKKLLSKGNVQQNEKATHEAREDIFLNHISDKRLISKNV